MITAAILLAGVIMLIVVMMDHAHPEPPTICQRCQHGFSDDARDVDVVVHGPRGWRTIHLRYHVACYGWALADGSFDRVIMERRLCDEGNAE